MVAYIQGNIPNPNKSYDHAIVNFSGGLNNASESLDANESPYLVNMSFSNDTLMEKRKGQIQYSATNYREPITYIDLFRQHEAEEGPISTWGVTNWGDKFNKDGDYLVTATDKNIYVEHRLIAQIGGRISGCTHEGKYFFTDTKNLFVYGKFDTHDTTYTKVIGAVPEENVLLRIISPSDDYVPLPKSEKKKEIVGDTEVEIEVSYTRGVLKTDYTLGTICYEPCAYELEDTYSGANVIPEKPSYILSYNGRLYIGGVTKDNDTVFISDIQSPFYFPAVLPLQLVSNADKIVGLTVYDGCIIVGRKYDIYSISGTTNRLDAGLELFSLKKLNTHTGFANNNCFNFVHNYLFFLGHDGVVYALSSGRSDEATLATQVISKQLNLRSDPINISTSDFSSVATCYYDDEWYLSIGDKVLIYNYNLRAWTMHTGYNARSFKVIKYNLIWGNDSGTLVTRGEDYLDFNGPYKAIWKSKIFYLDSPTYNKYYRHFYILADNSGMDYSRVNTNIHIDYRDTFKEYSIINSVSKWGSSIWGSNLIDSNINPSLPFYINSSGKSIQFEFSNGYNVVGDVPTSGYLYAYGNKRNGNTVYVFNEDCYYLYDTRTAPEEADLKAGYGWVKLNSDDLNQPMKVIQVNFTYENRRRVY